MSQFNLGQFLTKVVDYSLSGIRGNSTESTQKPHPGQESFSKSLTQKPHPQAIAVTPLYIKSMPMQNLRMNHLEALDKALYVKDLMKLPKDMSELLNFVKKNLSNSNSSSLLNSSLNIDKMALLLQQNGKEAVSKLIMTMSSASKQGVSDLSLMKETMKLINASVSLAEQNNPSLVVKSLMLLYLPWLPVNEGVGFELEVESSEEKSDGTESSITVMISTKNYGNLRATLVLLSGNSVTVMVNCSDSFPKEELLKRIKAESATHSVQPSVVFETNVANPKIIKEPGNISQQAKMNVSNNSSVNPFLLLMAHSVIKHTFEIDNAGG